jgi:hypothetical protein
MMPIRKQIPYLKELYEGSLFAPLTCDDERRFNPLRTLIVFSLESVNGFTKISDLIAADYSKNPVRACLLCLASQLAPDLRGPLPAAGGGLAALLRGLARGVSC